METPNLNQLKKRPKAKVFITIDKAAYDSLKIDLDAENISFSDLVDNWVSLSKDLIQEMKDNQVKQLNSQRDVGGGDAE